MIVPGRYFEENPNVPVYAVDDQVLDELNEMGDVGIQLYYRGGCETKPLFPNSILARPASGGQDQVYYQAETTQLSGARRFINGMKEMGRPENPFIDFHETGKNRRMKRKIQKAEEKRLREQGDLELGVRRSLEDQMPHPRHQDQEHHDGQ